MSKRMALRRKRTINPKYLSEDFESAFSEKKTLLSTDVCSENVVMVDQANLQVHARLPAVYSFTVL